jgi:hypothetical protein
MIDDLLKEMGETLEFILECFDTGLIDVWDLDPSYDEIKEDVMERIADVLSCYRHVDYEVVDGDVVWPEGRGGTKDPLPGTESSGNA